ncbi:MAG: response regulator [Candidatus Marinimicrobia bacterium]|nr:response regulator [Candidatus Neomarinimicrobiota bacterium]
MAIYNQTPSPPGILIADKDEQLFSIYTKFFNRRGNTVYLAVGGESAIQRYHDHSTEIALVIIEIQMPGMDGLTLRHAIKTLDPQLPVIAVSIVDEYNTAFSDNSRLNEEFNEIIRKPFHPDILHKIVDQYL